MRNTYFYDSANRLVSVSNQSSVSSYQYNGLGDRLSQTVNGAATNYTLDLNTGLTQVLSDGTTAYLYGNGRIAQVNTTSEYFLGDALGSVRQMTDPASEITFTQSYDPYGVVTSTSGESHTEYGYTGEQYGDSTQLLYLRARYYNPADGRFQSRDTWSGDVNRPLSMNQWMYVEGNPINRIDPTGLTPLQKGYLEGVSTTRSGLGNATIFGEEIVYDYATMTRARFKYKGDIGGIYASFFDATIYLGGITGFKYEKKDKLLSGGGDLNSNSAYPDLPYSQKIIEDYRGATDGWYLGGIAGVGYFYSSNGYIKGVFDYISIGASPINFEAVTFHTEYKVDKAALPGYNNSGIEYYYDVKTGNVNRGKLLSDILSGDHSAIRGNVFTEF